MTKEAMTDMFIDRLEYLLSQVIDIIDSGDYDVKDTEELLNRVCAVIQQMIARREKQ